MQKNILNSLIEITTLENKKNKKSKKTLRGGFLGFFWVVFLRPTLI